MNQFPLPEDTTIFLKGVAEGKRLMLDEAVEGTVVELGGENKERSISVGMDELNQVLRPLELKEGDKVRVIVIKEDGK